MAERGGGKRLPLVMALAAIAGIAAGLAVVYVRESADGNAAAVAGASAGGDCSAAVTAAALLQPFAKGEVAAFQPIDRPVQLSQLAFKHGDGTAASLADFGGKTVLLNLWATWCVPCRKEMPALGRLAEAEAGADFAVVPVSIDTQDPGKPKAFLDQIGVTSLPLYADPTTKIFGALKSEALAVGLPTTVLIDGKGCALGVVSGPAEWDSNDAKALIAAARKSV